MNPIEVETRITIPVWYSEEEANSYVAGFLAGMQREAELLGVQVTQLRAFPSGTPDPLEQ